MRIISSNMICQGDAAAKSRWVLAGQVDKKPENMGTAI